MQCSSILLCLIAHHAWTIDANEAVVTDSDHVITSLFKTAPTNSRSIRAWSPLQRALRSLLRNTLGYKSTWNLGLKSRTFVKVGTMDTALADIKSLQPEDLVQTNSDFVKGRIGNQDITIRRSFDRVILDIGDNPKTNLRLIYFEKRAAANAFIDGLANFKFRNYY